MSAEEQFEEMGNALGLSDEELLNMTPHEFAEFKRKKTEETAEEPKEEESVEEEEPETSEEPEEEQEPEEEEEPEEQVARQDIYEGAQELQEEEEEEPGEPQVVAKEPANGVDYKAEYEKLLSPFRASKREIQVKNVDDARALMQMGVDYRFKMEALKPKMRILRALEKQGLLEEDKINFLIDLDKKNPEAIKKFLKEKEIDPMEVDLTEESEYKPQSYAPSDQEIAIDEVLEDIRQTETFDRTLDELGNKWDGESRKTLMQHPQLIKMINDQIGAGIYDQIMNTVASERMLGRLQGLNDLMAYKTIGDALQAAGAFDHLKSESKPKRKPSQDPKLKARKRAASPTKRSSKAQVSAKDFNPLALSDEEFEKMQMPRFV